MVQTFVGAVMGSMATLAILWFSNPSTQTPVETKPRYADMEWQQVLDAKDAGNILCFQSSPLAGYQVNPDSMELALQRGEGLVGIVLYKGVDVYPFVLVQGVPYMVCWKNDATRQVVWVHPSGASGMKDWEDVPPGGMQ